MSHEVDNFFETEFQKFVFARVRPALEDAIARKNRLFRRSLGAGAAATLFSAALIWLFIQSYRELFGLMSFSLRLFIFLPALSLGVVLGSMSYLVLLKRMMDKLRLSILDNLAVFIDPCLSITSGGLPGWEGAPGGGFPEEAGKTSFGKEVFAGVRKGVEVRLSSVRLPPDKGKAVSSALARVGVVAQVRFPGALAGFEFGRAFLSRLNGERERRGIDFSHRLEQNVLSLILLRPAGADAALRPLDNMDLEQYRAFWLDARLCLEAADDLAEWASGGGKAG
ncbi:MAG: hypothetical protein LBU23_07705 [Planctomycetota bacterium]|jgi:hypothetical protein|nr:hypothetical protein [Planctomycetota bacterium]